MDRKKIYMNKIHFLLDLREVCFKIKIQIFLSFLFPFYSNSDIVGTFNREERILTKENRILRYFLWLKRMKGKRRIENVTNKSSNIRFF